MLHGQLEVLRTLQGIGSASLCCCANISLPYSRICCHFTHQETCETIFATYEKRSWGDRTVYTGAEYGGERTALLAAGPAGRRLRPSAQWVPTTRLSGFSCCTAAPFAFRFHFFISFFIFRFCWLLIQGERNLDSPRAESWMNIKVTGRCFVSLQRGFLILNCSYKFYRWY